MGWRSTALAGLAFAMTACTVQRSQIATEAQARMIGMPKEQLLACMGPPARKETVGATEVWSYDSGDNATASGYGNGFAFSSTRHCTVNVTMNGGAVAVMNYLGPAGGLFSPNEQCAFAVATCIGR